MKEVYLTEGRSTGVPTIQEKLRANGSPKAVFETDEDRLAFLVTIPVHEGCENRLSFGTSSETSSETPTKTIDKILKTIGERPGITNSELADIFGISLRAVGKHLKNLRDNNLIVRTGSPTYGGGWKIVGK
ncbi:MAG: winged helix-turn-helix transcriptional regulator [Candidatus Cryptobacteroides sp.]|nr:winged helix-turn-helix transcriptional regulator [Bacteroidales bacterium]MDY2772951.1 winged helix-turn-helix transcriptional regulator [Candidatus Cryptobacteroides sp.]